jgi:hypothetical protein
MAPLMETPPVDFTLILCEAAHADPAGTLHMLGAGWSVTGTPTGPQALALLIKVPWDRANERLPLAVELLSEDGHPVVLSGPGGAPTPIRAEAVLEVGRPVGVAKGSPLDASFAINFGSLPLAAGRYQWKAEIAGDQQSESFTVRPTP